ncbi:MAG: DUF6291 domain-containing protein [Candidatus Margulisbacteria bacterium]|jgi:hypothetical protein|nr:DUF6291 domain-containing protein [Candidatus Margulisiibacteriota bacterium]
MATVKTKQAFLVYYDYEPIFKELADDEKASLLMSMFEYERTREVPKQLKGQARIVFIMIKNNLDRDREKWDVTRQKRAEAGSLGGQTTQERNKQIQANQANAPSDKQIQANQAVNANAIAIATVNVPVNVNANADAMHTEADVDLSTDVNNSESGSTSTGIASAPALDLSKDENTNADTKPQEILIPETSVSIVENKVVAQTNIKSMPAVFGAEENYQTFKAAVRAAVESYGWNFAEFNISKFTEKYFGDEIKNMEHLVFAWQEQEELSKKAKERRRAEKTDWLNRI